MFALVKRPFVLRDVRLPSDVIKGCADVDTVPKTLLEYSCITLVVPDTLRDASVPREVTFGCVEVTSEPTIDVRLV